MACLGFFQLLFLLWISRAGLLSKSQSDVVPSQRQPPPLDFQRKPLGDDALPSLNEAEM